MSLREPEDRRSGRRSRDPSPAYYDERDRRSSRTYDDRDGNGPAERSSRYVDREYSRDTEPRYARAEKTAEPPYAGKKTASFVMPGGFGEDEERGYEKREGGYEKREEDGKGDGLAYGDKKGNGRGYVEKKIKELSGRYYGEEPARSEGGERRESKRYYADEPRSKYERQPERERSRERSSKQYYDDQRLYEQEPRKRESKQYYDERVETETRYAVSKPTSASKYESSPKPKYAQPVSAAPSVAAATKGSSSNKYYPDDSDTDTSESDGPIGDRRLDVEIDFKHHDKSDVTVRKRPSRKEKQYHLDESSSALVMATTTTSGAQYGDQGRYGSYAPPNSYDRPPSGRPVEDYERYERQSQRPGYGSATTSESRITTISTNGRKQEADVVTAEPGHRKRASMGATLGASLSIGTGAGFAAGSLSQAPVSPMLEAYKGTYQSMGSMPSPLMMPSAGFSSSQDMAILDLNRAPSPSGRERRARFHDLKDDALKLKKVLDGKSRSPDPRPFIDVLPSLSHDEILNLRKEYKLQVFTPDHRGVNVAKHIKMRLKEDKLFLKCCYTTALGKFESEGYWANSYYNSSQTSRELLIEALMGRSNEEVRRIKDGFKDKKYSDDLVKCMKTELKEDKFKRAVMLVLKEGKMEEPTRSRPVERRMVEGDVRELYKAVRSERGGETAMIDIVVLRSEAHMREVLRVYEQVYRANFAKDALRKSGNLVGEMLAHILNGIINRPVRDAMLLDHALSLPSSDPRRPDLLISRLVRYHWDREHFENVKAEFRRRQGRELGSAVEKGTKGVWGEFCTELCVRRMGGETREYERGTRIEMR